MKTIWKFPISPALNLPDDAEILSLGVQGGAFYMWALVDTEKSYNSRQFEIVGTGWALTDDFAKNSEYVGTIHEDNFVWHVFEVKR